MITHTNRKGQTWYLKRSVTKAGKTRWTASKDRDAGENAAAMPEGYAFHENVNGQVFVRKKRALKILPEEVALVERVAEGDPYRMSGGGEDEGGGGVCFRFEEGTTG